MTKIDLDKLICSLAKRKYFSEEKLQGALKEQGLEYKDGEIVEVQKLKFHEGDWIVQEDIGVYKVIEVCESWYEVVDNEDKHYSIGFDKEYMCHIWTIEDAKDGDVLACGDKVTDCPFIFHNLNEELNPRSYCGVNTLRHFQDNDENGGSWCNSDGVRPATKEQRDLLFQKMKEAGYEWDDEKKELKKIGDSVEKALRKAGYEWSEETHQLKKIENTRPMLSDFFNAEYESGKASFANRQLYNRAILTILSNYVEKYPDIRFGQMLYNLGIGPVFNEESRETHWNLSKTIDKRK